MNTTRLPSGMGRGEFAVSDWVSKLETQSDDDVARWEAVEGGLVEVICQESRFFSYGRVTDALLDFSLNITVPPQNEHDRKLQYH